MAITLLSVIWEDPPNLIVLFRHESFKTIALIAELFSLVSYFFFLERLDEKFLHFVRMVYRSTKFQNDFICQVVSMKKWTEFLLSMGGWTKTLWKGHGGGMLGTICPHSWKNSWKQKTQNPLLWRATFYPTYLWAKRQCCGFLPLQLHLSSSSAPVSFYSLHPKSAYFL